MFIKVQAENGKVETKQVETHIYFKELFGHKFAIHRHHDVKTDNSKKGIWVISHYRTGYKLYSVDSGSKVYLLDKLTGWIEYRFETTENFINALNENIKDLETINN